MKMMKIMTSFHLTPNYHQNYHHHRPHLHLFFFQRFHQWWWWWLCMVTKLCIKTHSSFLSVASSYSSTSPVPYSLNSILKVLLAILLLPLSLSATTNSSINVTVAHRVTSPTFPSSPPPRSSRSLPASSNITDIIVNVGTNVLLECDSFDSIYTGGRSYDHDQNKIRKNGDNDDDDDMIFDRFTRNRRGDKHRHNNNNNGDEDNLHHLHRHANAIKYIWCRYEQDWVQESSISPSNDGDDVDELPTQENPSSSPSSSSTASAPFLRYKTCFEGDRHFVASENRISTVIYRCGVIHRTTGKVFAVKLWKLYIDQFVSAYTKRDTTTFMEYQQRHSTAADVSSTPSSAASSYKYHAYQNPNFVPRYQPPNNSNNERHCTAPRCKPYATVLRARCSTIELTIRYPSTQYGYNQSINHWGTIWCNDHIGGYQLWLIGYGVVKKFLPNESIIIDNLIPGKRYCFNGWAYNGCGSGPVFTLEGVCAKNLPECNSTSDEHCELDVDYSY